MASSPSPKTRTVTARRPLSSLRSPLRGGGAGSGNKSRILDLQDEDEAFGIGRTLTGTRSHPKPSVLPIFDPLPPPSPTQGPSTMLTAATPPSVGPATAPVPVRPSLSASERTESSSSAGSWNVMGGTKAVRKRASGFLKDAARSWGRSKSRDTAAPANTVGNGSPPLEGESESGIMIAGPSTAPAGETRKGLGIKGIIRKKSEIAFRGWHGAPAFLDLRGRLIDAPFADTLEKIPGSGSSPSAASPLTPTAPSYQRTFASHDAPFTSTRASVAPFPQPLIAPATAPAHLPQLDQRGCAADWTETNHHRRETSASSGLYSSGEEGHEIATPTVATFGQAMSGLAAKRSAAGKDSRIPIRRHSPATEVRQREGLRLTKDADAVLQPMAPVRISPRRTRAQSAAHQPISRSPIRRHHRPSSAMNPIPQSAPNLQGLQETHNRRTSRDRIQSHLQGYSISPLASTSHAEEPSMLPPATDLASPFVAADPTSPKGSSFRNIQPPPALSFTNPAPASASSSTRRLRSGSNARANLFGASPDQAGGFDPLPDLQPQHRRAGSTASSMFDGSNESAGSRSSGNVGSGLVARSKPSGRARMMSQARDGLTSRSSSAGTGFSSMAGHLDTLRETEVDGDDDFAPQRPSYISRGSSGSRMMMASDSDDDSDVEMSVAHGSSDVRNRTFSRHPSSPSVASSSRHGHRPPVKFAQTPGQLQASSPGVDECGSPLGFASRRASQSSVKGCSSLSRRPSSSISLRHTRDREFSADSLEVPASTSGKRKSFEEIDEAPEPEEDSENRHVRHFDGRARNPILLDLQRQEPSFGYAHDDSGYGASPFAKVPVNVFDGFGAVAPPDSPFASNFRGRTHGPATGTPSSPFGNGRLKRGADGTLLSESGPSRSKLGPGSSVRAQSPSGSINSWGRRSVPQSEDEDEEGEADHDHDIEIDDEADRIGSAAPARAPGSTGTGSFESHDASSLNIPALTDSSSLSSSLNSSNGPPHEPRSASSDGFFDLRHEDRSHSVDQLGAERHAKRRSLPNNMGNLNMLTLANPALRSLAESGNATRAIGAFSTPQFKNAKPSAAAFMSTGLVSKKANGRSRRNSLAAAITPAGSNAAPSSFARAIAERNLFGAQSHSVDTSLGTPGSTDRSFVPDESLAAESMREALGGLDPNVVRADAMEGVVASPAPHLAIPSALPPPSALARRTSVKSFRMPDTPIKQPSFLAKKSHASHASSKPFVSSALSSAITSAGDSPTSTTNSPGPALLAPDSPALARPRIFGRGGLSRQSSEGSSTLDADTSQSPSSRSSTSGSSASPTLVSKGTRNANGSIGTAAAKRQRLLFRRRSSDAVLGFAVKGLAVDVSGGASRIGSQDDEPMTPTRAAVGNALSMKSMSSSAVIRRYADPFITGAQLIRSPANSGAKDSPTQPIIVPALILPTGTSGLTTPRHPPRPQMDYDTSPSATSADTSAEIKRLSPPKRPGFRSRHSSSTLEEARAFENQQVNRLETDFEVQDVLGAGEFSDAFRVLEKATGGIFAVKRTKKPIGGPKAR